MEKLIVPLECLNIHEERARRVRHIRRVNSTRGAAREVPQQPRVDRAEE